MRKHLALAIAVTFALVDIVPAITYPPETPPEMLVGSWVGWSKDDAYFVRLDLAATGGVAVLFFMDDVSNEYVVESWSQKSKIFAATLRPIDHSRESVRLIGKAQPRLMQVELRWKEAKEEVVLRPLVRITAQIDAASRAIASAPPN